MLCFIIYSIGTIAGLYEKVILRMVAFSSIANFGFIVLGLCLSSIDGFIVVIFYFLVYSLGLILLFLILSVAKHEGSWREIKYINELYTLVNYNPIIGLLALVSLLSLAGVPPFPGFFAKALLLRSLFIEGHFILFFLVLSISIVSVVYYIRVIRMIFFGESRLYSGSLVISVKNLELYFIGFISCLNIWFIWKQVFIYEFLVWYVSISGFAI